MEDVLNSKPVIPALDQFSQTINRLNEIVSPPKFEFTVFKSPIFDSINKINKSLLFLDRFKEWGQCINAVSNVITSKQDTILKITQSCKLPDLSANLTLLKQDGVSQNKSEKYVVKDWVTMLEGTCLLHRVRHSHSMVRFEGESYTANEAKWFNDTYKNEKSKGGLNSHQRNKPLMRIVQNICRQELAKNKFSSAIELCKTVAKIIENDYLELLKGFQPYKKSLKTAEDWRQPTFYKWCKDIYFNR